MLNRFANIFYHYYSGPLAGFRLRLWPSERDYPVTPQITALILFCIQLFILITVPLPSLIQFGLTFILFSPQWLYCLIPSLPHPIFEYRAYGMSIGIALILASILSSHPVLTITLLLLWLYWSVVRYRTLTDPLRFWARAEQENSHGS